MCGEYKSKISDQKTGKFRERACFFAVRFDMAANLFTISVAFICQQLLAFEHHTGNSLFYQQSTNELLFL
jgi:hypothetical protein